MNQSKGMRWAAVTVMAGATAWPLAAQTAEPSPSRAEPRTGSAQGAREAQRTQRGDDGFEGYDFGQVVTTMETSVNPLQREMDQSFRLFVESVEAAERLLDEGRTQEAVQQASAALEVVLAARDRVLVPMWDGQQVLAEQIAMVRARLATAVQAALRGPKPKLDQQADVTLDRLATRISREKDELRKKRLVSHYRTVRNLARIRAMAVQLSPDQRKMWMNVLHVLDQAALAHQRVMMGSEVLFAQFEATSANLQSYLSLMDTVDGASRLIRIVGGADEQAAGMTGFADSMNQLQQRLARFNESVEQALEGRMLQLEAEIDTIAPISGDLGEFGVAGVDEDGELSARIARLAPDTNPARSPAPAGGQGGQP